MLCDQSCKTKCTNDCEKCGSSNGVYGNRYYLEDPSLPIPIA